ncbi:hypothetical protein DYB37_002585 [Aphanomyces astaci]|uniref:Uncharacterized protein n=1 Tax=Aphanomyces astaci TaxID=112090 RepID=A0A3R7BLW3_APHAT|nr:hypothetical protein DYB35_002655 [Aphanomyces astaci]RHZ24596.1 hypothetical protein DYB37_002585 [Aphanomyces astaci]
MGDDDLRTNDYYLRSVEVDPVPSTWLGMLFAGGGGICVYHDLVPFVQDSFGHNDACQVQKPFKVKLQPKTILFALLARHPRLSRLPSRTCTIVATKCRRLCHGGMITLGKFVFDLKLWMIYHPLRHERGSYTFASTIFQQPTKVDDAPLANESTIRRRRLRLRACIGLGYVITTITGSYSYLELSKNDFSNDYLWTSFDATGTLTCWYNNNLQMTTALSLQLTSTPFGDLSLPYNSSEPPMLMVPLYVSSIHTNTLTNVVQSVRRMDGCALPWNHSPYCYVDFNRRNVNSVAGEVQSWQARNVTHYMLVPQDLVDVVKLAIEVLGGVGAQQEYLGAPVVSGFDSMPSAWDAYGVVADNILCGVGKDPSLINLTILTDTMSVLTRLYMPRYASKSSSAAWEMATMWTFILPATHRVSIHRVCEVAVLDFRSCVMPKPCTYIGQFSRFVGLIAAAVVMTMLCYPFERL